MYSYTNDAYYGSVIPVHFPGPAVFTTTGHPVTFVRSDVLEPPVDYNRDCTRGRTGLGIMIVLGVLAVSMAVSIIVMAFIVATKGS